MIELSIVIILIIMLLIEIIGTFIFLRTIFSIKEDIQIILKALSIDVAHNKRAADALEKATKLV